MANRFATTFFPFTFYACGHHLHREARSPMMCVCACVDVDGCGDANWTFEQGGKKVFLVQLDKSLIRGELTRWYATLAYQTLI